MAHKTKLVAPRNWHRHMTKLEKREHAKLERKAGQKLIKKELTGGE